MVKAPESKGFPMADTAMGEQDASVVVPTYVRFRYPHDCAGSGPRAKDDIGVSHIWPAPVHSEKAGTNAFGGADAREHVGVEPAMLPVQLVSVCVPFAEPLTIQPMKEFSGPLVDSLPPKRTTTKGGELAGDAAKFARKRAGDVPRADAAVPPPVTTPAPEPPPKQQPVAAEEYAASSAQTNERSCIFFLLSSFHKRPRVAIYLSRKVRTIGAAALQC